VREVEEKRLNIKISEIMATIESLEDRLTQARRQKAAAVDKEKAVQQRIGDGEAELKLSIVYLIIISYFGVICRSQRPDACWPGSCHATRRGVASTPFVAAP
jgi:hypothetical protein